MKHIKQSNIKLVRRLAYLVLCVTLASAAVIYALVNFTVAAVVETDPHTGDADDPAIWIHPTDPSLSLILGTFKKEGIGVYNMDGSERQFVDQDGGMNNVDLRYNFPLGGQKVDLVVATNNDATHNTLAIYKVNPSTRMLENVTADPPVQTAVEEVYGSCMYVSPISGKYYAFLTDKKGNVEQWELFDNGSGQVDGTMVRTFDLGGQSEGCVADDVLADFYVSEEADAIWQYGAEPGDGIGRTAVDLTATGHVTADIEGLAIYYTNLTEGYLLASNQSQDEYVIYERSPGFAYRATFGIGAGNGIDVVTQTDGIDITNVPLGPQFPQGAFVAQDGDNDTASKNFKLVPWPDIASEVNPPLTIDTTWNPRLVGLPPQADFSASSRAGSAPLTANFSDQSSGVRSSWLWDFGDGNTSTASNPSHTYTEKGRYTVSLTVANVFGSDTETKTDYIEVNGNEVKPTAVFQANVTSGAAPLTVTFDNQSTGSFDSCIWDFGDGLTNSSCADAVHTYTKAGVYSVSLQVSGPAGNDISFVADYITVDEPQHEIFLPLALWR